MSIKKRGKYWRIHFFTPEGQEVRLSSGTEDKQQALELENELKKRAWRDSKLGEMTTKSWEDACERWFEEKAGKKSIEADRSRARWLNQSLSGMFLNDITEDLIEEIGRKKKNESSNSTANRHLQLLRAILKIAETRWKWLYKAPHVQLYPEPRSRVRWLTPEQAKALISELPKHQKISVTLALCTGQRQANIMALQWHQVDLARRSITISGEFTKNGKDLGVPLNDMAYELLSRLAENKDHPDNVISYRGKPVKRANTAAWKKALKRAGIENFRWHDLRHTWASWHVQNGTPLLDLQEMGGWEESKMVRRYAHLDVSHLQKHANKLSF